MATEKTPSDGNVQVEFQQGQNQPAYRESCSEFHPTPAMIALWYGRHINGDKQATQRLQQWGCIAPELPQQPSSEPKPAINRDIDIRTESVSPATVENVQAFDATFFTVNNRQTLAEPEESGAPQKIYTRQDDQPEPCEDKPQLLPLESGKALLKKIFDALKVNQTGPEPDLRKLTESVASAETLETLPFYQEEKLPDRLFVYIDFPSFSRGYKQDVLQLIDLLEEHRGNLDIQFIHIISDKAHGWRYKKSRQKCVRPTGKKNSRRQKKAIPLPDSRESQVLFVSHYSHATWQRHHALLTRLNRIVGRINWLSVAKVPVSCSVHIHWLPWGKSGIVEPDILNQLVALFQSVRCIDDLMLREVLKRFDLPSCYENAFWQHPFTQYQAGEGIVCINNAADRQPYLDLLAKIPLATIDTFSLLIDKHLRYVSQSVRHEHIVLLSLMAPQYYAQNDQHRDINASIDFLTTMAANIQTCGDDTQGNAGFLQDTINQARGLLSGAPGRLQKTLAVANLHQYQNGKISQVEDELATDVLRLTAKGAPPGKLHIYQKNNQLIVLSDEQQNLHRKTQQMVLLASIKTGKPDTLVAQYSDSYTTTLKAINTVPEWVTEFKIISQFEELTIEKRKMSDFWWAENLSIDDGEVVAITDNVRASWESNGQTGIMFKTDSWYKKVDFEPESQGIFSRIASRLSDWWGEGAESRFSRLPPEFEVDTYGLVATWKVKNVGFKMRYIPPGAFKMGSSLEEPERDDDETLHPVTISKGFWIGETTVTQRYGRPLWVITRVILMRNKTSNYPLKKLVGMTARPSAKSSDNR